MRSVDEIYTSLCAKFSEKSGVSIVEGGDMSLRLYTVAYELATLEANADFVARQAYPQTAVGEYLDLHAQMRGLERGKAMHAKGLLRFYTNEPAVAAHTIPAGTVCISEAMEEFVTLSDCRIAIGETWCETEAKAKNAGKAGNAPAGTITVMELAPVGVEGVTNVAAFAGGCDAESDEELSERVVQSYRRLPNGANRAYYEQKALSVDGVCEVQVFPKTRGIGTLDIVVSGHSGMPADEIVDEVKRVIDAQREICVDILVLAPEPVMLELGIGISFDSGADMQKVKKLVREKLQEYFNGERLGKHVFRAKLISLVMEVDGVENCVVAYPTDDVGIAQWQIPVLKTLTINGEN